MSKQFSQENKTLVVDNYDSFTYNLVQLLGTVSDAEIKIVRNNEITFSDILAFKPTRIVLSPGPGNPSNKRDFGVCREILDRQQETGAAILGVCLGHQGIASSNGARVEKLTVPVHGKTSTINITDDSRLFSGISGQFSAMRYHSLFVSDTNFPTSLKVTARSEGDDVVMALEDRQRPVYGIQFHPESIATPEGKKMMENFITLC